MNVLFSNLFSSSYIRCCTGYFLSENKCKGKYQLSFFIFIGKEYTVESLKFMEAIFVDSLNFTGSWGSNFVYFFIPTKENMILLH